MAKRRFRFERKNGALAINGQFYDEAVANVIPKLGTGASAEGYYANNVFNAFLVEADQGTPVSAAPQATITRAQARERTPNNARGDEVEVRGSVTLGHVAANVNTQNVRVFRVDGNTQTLLGDVTATRAVDTPNVATFIFRVTTPPTNNAVLGVSPTTVRVVNTSPGALNASATAPVEVR